MKFKLFKIVAITVSITATLFNGTLPAKNQSNTCFSVVPAIENPIKTVIFDLGEVLIKPSRSKQTTILLSMALRYPSLLYSLTKYDIKKELFAMLHNVPAHTNIDEHVMYNQGEQMPQIMVDWQTGRSNVDISAAILTYLATNNYSSTQKILFSKIIQLIFQPSQLVKVLHPIEPMVKLAHALKAHGYKLYVLSNWDAESFPLLVQKHKYLFDLFDDILISGTEGIGKPNHQFYTTLLEKNNLDPSECIFIDDEPHNIAAACDLGIHGILHDSFNSTCLHLRNLGVLQTIIKE